MSEIQMILGSIVAIGAIYLLVKKVETRVVLFTAGLIMCLIAAKPMLAFTAFSEAIGKRSLFEPIVTVMGYSVVMKVTHSDESLILILTRYLKKAGPFLIPGVVLATFFINVSLTSTAGIAAAVGSIFIPLLVSAGVHPAVAASAVLCGTFGSFLNPGYPMNALTAEVSAITPTQVVSNHLPAVMIAVLTAAITLTIVAVMRKENKGFEHLLDTEVALDTEKAKINYVRAFLPLLPLVIIIVGSMNVIPGVKSIAISHSILMSLIVTVLVTRESPSKISKEFFKGFGNAFGSVFGIIVAATVFTTGLEAIGLIEALMNLMVQFPHIAKISSAAGPFVMAVVTGSGEAATTAFNSAVTVNAAQFGIIPQNMGSVAGLAGAYGRAMSPLAGGAIILGGYGKVDTMEIAKRNAIPMIVTAIVTTLVLLYI